MSLSSVRRVRVTTALATPLAAKVDVTAFDAAVAALEAARIAGDTASGYRNRWKDARFRALYDAVPVFANGTPALDGKSRINAVSGTITWSLSASPHGNPSIACSGGATDFYHYLDEGLFRQGENVRAKIGLIAQSGSTFNVTMFARNGFNGTVLGNTANVAVTANDSYVEIDMAALAIPSGTTALAIRVIRTAGAGTATVCALQAVTGHLARPMEEDGASRYTAAKAQKAADAAAIIASDTASAHNAMFERGKNHFDPNDPGVELGKFVQNTDGGTGGNASYNATGFVPLDDGDQYTLSYAHSRAFYDANKVFISGEPNGAPATFTKPVGAAFGRFTVLASVWGTFQVEAGATATSFEPYSYGIRADLLPDESATETPDDLNAARLRNWHYLRRKRLLGESAQIHIGLWGDSFTHTTSRWSGPFADTLIALLGDAGGGWTGFGFNAGGTPPYTPPSTATQPPARNMNVRAAYYCEFTGDWTSDYNTANSPDTSCANSSTAGALVRAYFPATPTLSGVDLFWIGTADGVIEYSWDGTTWTSMNVQGTVGNCQFAALSGVPTSGAGSLQIRVVSGSVKLPGVNWKSAAPGVVVHKLAGTGSRMQQLAAQMVKADVQAAIAALGIKVAVVMHGANDQASSRPTADFAANGQTVVEGVKTALPGADILLIAEPENQRGYSPPMKNYQAALAEKAAGMGISFLNTQRSFGDPDNPTEYGSAGAVPMMNADDLHPEPATGGRALLDAALRFLGVR